MCIRDRYYNDPAYSVEFEIKSDRVWQVVGNATNDMDEYLSLIHIFQRDGSKFCLAGTC